MAVQDHLKIASAELMKAAELVRQEIADLRNEENNLQKSVEDNISRLTYQIHSREQEVKLNDDPSARAQGQTVINTLLRQIADARSQLKKDQQRIQDAIRQKETVITSINQQAKSLQI